MIWNENSPNDNVGEASAVIPPGVKDAKVMIRERLTSPNGAAHEHFEATNAAFGKHPASKISVVRFHASAATIPTGAAFENTLHCVTPEGQAPVLYTVRQGAAFKLQVQAHSELVINANTVEQEHPQYILKAKVGGDNVPIPLAYDGAVIQASSLTIPNLYDVFLPSSHNTETYQVAHGVAGLSVEQIADNTCRLPAGWGPF